MMPIPFRYRKQTQASVKRLYKRMQPRFMRKLSRVHDRIVSPNPKRLWRLKIYVSKERKDVKNKLNSKNERMKCLIKTCRVSSTEIPLKNSDWISQKIEPNLKIGETKPHPRLCSLKSEYVCVNDHSIATVQKTNQKSINTITMWLQQLAIDIHMPIFTCTSPKLNSTWVQS